MTVLTVMLHTAMVCDRQCVVPTGSCEYEHDSLVESLCDPGLVAGCAIDKGLLPHSHGPTNPGSTRFWYACERVT